MIGQPLQRLEDRRLVTGHGRYTDDINLDGQAYAAFLRSPHAHARIARIDIEAAASAPGVLAVLTGNDYLAAGLQGISHPNNPAAAVLYRQPTFTDSKTGSIFRRPHLPLAVDKARFVGEALAMVVAETAAQARAATELIDVDYEILDAVVRADDAMLPGAPLLWDGAPSNLCFQIENGDRAAVEKAFATAFHVVRREFRHSRVVSSQMEPRAAIGSYDAAENSYLLISGCQGVFRQKLGLCAALGVAPEKLRVVCPDVGGGFGSRSMLAVEQLAVVWAARQVGRPVKWTGERSEAFVSDYQGRDAVIRAAIAFAQDGRILAMDHQWIGNVGAHPVSYVPIANGAYIITTVYHIPALALHISAVLTNTVPVIPYRGAGRPEATHMVERMLDIAAGELKLDRLEIRRRNLVPRNKLPYQTPTGLSYDSGDFHANMERAAALSDWTRFAARRDEARQRGKLRGIGLANYIEAPVGIPSERIEMTILPDGTVDIVAGTQSTGQGHETTFAQVVAAQLGVPMDKVRLRTGDTAFVMAGGGTLSDRSMRIGGTLLLQASAAIIKTGLAVAARLLNTAAENVRFVDGAFQSRQNSAVTLGEVARHVSVHGLPHDSSAKSLRAEIDFNGRLAAHPTGAVVCELEVDPDTGDVSLCHYTTVDDVGKLINPLIVEGQVHGGLAQGIGQALCEGYYLDKDSGQVLSGSYMDYGVPRADCMPRLSSEFTEDPTVGNPLGVKGGGESGITPATAAIFNALADALHHISAAEIAMPATPEVIWNFIHSRAVGDSTNR